MLAHTCSCCTFSLFSACGVQQSQGSLSRERTSHQGQCEVPQATAQHERPRALIEAASGPGDLGYVHRARHSCAGGMTDTQGKAKKGVVWSRHRPPCLVPAGLLGVRACPLEPR